MPTSKLETLCTGVPRRTASGDFSCAFCGVSWDSDEVPEEHWRAVDSVTLPPVPHDYGFEIPNVDQPVGMRISPEVTDTRAFRTASMKLLEEAVNVGKAGISGTLPYQVELSEADMARAMANLDALNDRKSVDLLLGQVLEALQVAEVYVQSAFSRAQLKMHRGRKLPADHPISIDLARVHAALAAAGTPKP